MTSVYRSLVSNDCCVLVMLQMSIGNMQFLNESKRMLQFRIHDTYWNFVFHLKEKHEKPISKIMLMHFSFTSLPQSMFCYNKAQVMLVRSFTYSRFMHRSQFILSESLLVGYMHAKKYRFSNETFYCLTQTIRGFW